MARRSRPRMGSAGQPRAQALASGCRLRKGLNGLTCQRISSYFPNQITLVFARHLGYFRDNSSHLNRCSGVRMIKTYTSFRPGKVRQTQEGRGRLRFVFWGTLLVLMLSSGRFTFAQIATGSIVGTVMDSSGGVIAGATVAVTNQATGLT